MKILIVQAKRSNDLSELKNNLLYHDFDSILLPEGYISNESLLEEACALAKSYNVSILSSYLADMDRKDKACLIDEAGKVVLNRKKSLLKGPLLLPSKAIVNGILIGYMLCCEIFLDYSQFREVDMIVNPIGVGMFSEKQFDEWSERAKKIARELECIVVGASHSDGTYKDCNVSIPIAYFFDKEGNEIFLSKDDCRTVIVDIQKQEVTYIGNT